MQPEISICRKRENVYLKLTGDLNETSPEELLEALKKLMSATLQITSPKAKVLFLFQTHAKVDWPKG
jgi:hypothetical protein